jgi:hypothetical protein
MQVLRETGSKVAERIPAIIRGRKDGRIAYQIDRALSSCIDPRETLVISGFWRSGTTWLQQAMAQLLRAKTVFEPLHFMVPEAKGVNPRQKSAAEDVTFFELYMPYCAQTTLDGSPLHDLFGRALRADISGRAVRLLRKSVRESFRLRVVVKCVKAPLFLRAAQDTFSMPVIHIYRDPRAVIGSIKLTGWSWLFDHLSLRDQLIGLNDGRADFFRNWYEEILGYDEQDMVTRITAYWALTEKFLLHSYANHRARFAFVNYDELTRGRERVLRDTLTQLGIRHGADERFRFLDGDSFTTTPQRRGVSVHERMAGWRRVLSGSEIAIVESIARDFGLGDRLAEDQ